MNPMLKMQLERLSRLFKSAIVIYTVFTTIMILTTFVSLYYGIRDNHTILIIVATLPAYFIFKFINDTRKSYIKYKIVEKSIADNINQEIDIYFTLDEMKQLLD